jgi:hypothetical protein
MPGIELPWLGGIVDIDGETGGTGVGVGVPEPEKSPIRSVRLGKVVAVTVTVTMPPAMVSSRQCMIYAVSIHQKRMFNGITISPSTDSILLHYHV